MALHGLYIAFTRDHFGGRKLARCAKHLPIEFYTVVMLLTFILIISVKKLNSLKHRVRTTVAGSQLKQQI